MTAVVIEAAPWPQPVELVMYLIGSALILGIAVYTGLKR